jgi:hypothetical protein
MTAHESVSRVEEVKASSDRVFGLVFTAFFCVVALLPWVFGRPIRFWALYVAAAFLVVALVVPKLLGPLNRLWMKFGALMQKIVNPIILGIIFFLVVTPMGVVMRAFGKDPLRLRLERGSRSYWIARQPPGPAPDTLNNQF